MYIGKDEQKRILSLKKMGTCMLLSGIFCAIVVYRLPSDETGYWLSEEGKEGFYVLSAFFCLIGLYCLGAVGRKNRFRID